MTNAEKFQQMFNLYATELWALPEKEFLKWLNTENQSEQLETVYCKDCKHRPKKNTDYDEDSWDCGFNIEFPDYICPLQCEDGYYNKFPEDNWFCGNGDRKS